MANQRNTLHSTRGISSSWDVRTCLLLICTAAHIALSLHTTYRLSVSDIKLESLALRNGMPNTQGTEQHLQSTRTTASNNKPALSFKPSVSDEKSNAALEALDENHAWMRHVKFLVIGTQKGGTTSLYTYLNGHSKTRSKGKECMCFEDYSWEAWDPECERKLRITWVDDSEDFVVGDYTPGYIHRSEEVVPRVRKTYPWVKIIATLREPASRAFSQYNMVCKNKHDADCDKNTFEAVVLKSLARIRKAGLLPHWYFHKPIDEMSVSDWLNAPVDNAMMDEFFGSEAMVAAWKKHFELEPRKDRHKHVVGQGFYAVGLFRWLSAFPRERFLILQSTDFKADVLAETMGRVFTFLDLAVEPLATTEEANVASTESSMEPEVEKLLKRVYAPYNAQLETLFGEEWKDPF